ncbi:MAG: hypothetical protein IJ526_04585 [Lachnospiraceae bacterium]|nr:hypothetical protein [Lachnospiraceae bacterium]
MAKNHWHPAFCGATEWELKQNRDDLTFEPEHLLSKEPLRMDMLIIKKSPNAVIQNEIGKIFRQHNVVEFKGSGDSLNIDDYHKVIGYACLYKSLGKHVNEIPADEVTVTIMREAYPKELFGVLKKSKIDIKEQYPGIYYLTGNVMFRTQIIVTRRLGDKHAGLKILSEKAKEADVRSFLQEAKQAKEPGDLQNIDAVLQVSKAANAKLYDEIRRSAKMYDALKDLMKDEIAEEVEASRTDEKLNSIKTLMKNMKWSAEQAMKALGVSKKDQARYMAML